MRSVCRSVVSVCLVTLVLTAPVPARALPVEERWLRIDDPVVAHAIAKGRKKSATFRALLDRLGRSDVIVYMLRAFPMNDRTRGDTRFVVQAGGFRFLRVRLEVHASTDSVVALIGHELRHVAEVADAPWIVDEASYGAHFKAVGFASCTRPQACYETNTAVLTGDLIMRELKRERAPLAARLEGPQVSVGD